MQHKSLKKALVKLNGTWKILIISHIFSGIQNLNLSYLILPNLVKPTGNLNMTPNRVGTGNQLRWNNNSSKWRYQKRGKIFNLNKVWNIIKMFLFEDYTWGFKVLHNFAWKTTFFWYLHFLWKILIIHFPNLSSRQNGKKFIF